VKFGSEQIIMPLMMKLTGLQLKIPIRARIMVPVTLMAMVMPVKFSDFTHFEGTPW